MSQPDGGPAFPTDTYFDEVRDGQMHGMSLRDYFAAKALPALIGEGMKIHHATLAAYRVADLMLAEREATHVESSEA